MNGLQVSQILPSAQNVNQSSGIKKKCPGCQKTKNLEDFYPDKRGKNGLRPRCKLCVKQWYKDNIEKCRESNRRAYRKSDPNKRCERGRIWYKNNLKRIRELNHRWNEKNPEKRKAIYRKANKKRNSTPRGQLNRNMSSAILKALRGNKNGRPWESLVGYTISQLKTHLEKRFKDGMTWENYGKWHLDHIIPITAFNFEKIEDIDFKRCWALKNLQPLWEKENISKSNKLKKPFQPSLIFR